MNSGHAYNYDGHFDWSFDETTDSKYKFEDFVTEHPMKLEQLKIKVQVFASKFGLNNCREDMGKIARERINELKQFQVKIKLRNIEKDFKSAI